MCELDKSWMIDFTVSGELWQRDGEDWKGNIDDVNVVSLFYPATEYIAAYWYSRFGLYVATPFLGRPPIVAKAMPEIPGMRFPHNSSQKAQHVKLETGERIAYSNILCLKKAIQTIEKKLLHSIQREGEEKKRSMNPSHTPSHSTNQPVAKPANQPTNDFKNPNAPTDIISH